MLINSNALNFRSLTELADDFYLMFRNAQEYNVEGSQIFLDSVALLSVFTQVDTSEFRLSIFYSVAVLRYIYSGRKR